MFLQTLWNFPEIKRSTSVMIGDSESDMLNAQNAEINGIKV